MAERLVPTRQEFRDFAESTHDQLSEEDFPNLRQHIRYHLDGKDIASDFGYMLNLILDGLERDLVTS